MAENNENLVFPDVALSAPEILLPKEGIDMAKWAVVACDQFTSQPEYWEMVDKLVGGEPSTLRLIFPEAFLEHEDVEGRIRNINRVMAEYLSKGLLVRQKPGFILVDRKTSNAESRKGLVVALDLECYDYNKGSKTLIRATEGTIVERLPPRIRIRENAPIELPHIMVLIDDPERTVIEPLFSKELEKAYDFDLMMQSGHIKGYRADSPELVRDVAAALSRLADTAAFKKKYGIDDDGVLLYAMGDGNHSLATAKAIWERLKKEAEDKETIMKHPARYALVELVNVHDQGLEFEPIHRVIFNVDAESMLDQMKAFFEDQAQGFSLVQAGSFEAMEESVQDPSGSVQAFGFASPSGFGVVSLEKPKLNLAVGSLQSFLDDFLKKNKDAKIDYVHGSDMVSELGSKKGNIGFFLPPMSKHELFKTVIVDGALPRKTFSMGEADEKRFYLECRGIN